MSMKWLRAVAHPCLPLGENHTVISNSEKHRKLSGNAAAECAVLIKNEQNFLPLKNGTKVALFGKGTIDYVPYGGGSGTVNIKDCVNILKGLKEKEKEGKILLYAPLVNFYIEQTKAHPFDLYNEQVRERKENEEYGFEPEVPKELIKSAAKECTTAIITLSLMSLEEFDRHPEKGDWYLSTNEKKLIDDVSKEFENVVVLLNICAVRDMRFIKENDKIKSALILWLNGNNGGAAAADLLVGDKTPSGKLADTVAYDITDYPSNLNFNKNGKEIIEQIYEEDIYVGYRYFNTFKDKQKKVLYPFGFGLSYSNFSYENTTFLKTDKEIIVGVDVKNNGPFKAKEIIQVYFKAPNTKILCPSVQLVDFNKTKLLNVNETQRLTLRFNISDMAAFDDTGKIKKSAFVLDGGEYEVFVSTSSVDHIQSFKFNLNETVVKEVNDVLYPDTPFERLLGNGEKEKVETKEVKEFNPVFEEIPFSRPEKCEIDFRKVASGEESLNDFIAKLTDEELLHLTKCQPFSGVGSTGATGNLPQYFIPNFNMADGPAGIRIEKFFEVITTAFPSATAIACSFDRDLAHEISSAGAKELKENNLTVWLAPALNIHRHPLCGRNFEYYSEDPVLSGKMAAAAVNGIQENGVSATIKHFAANNCETNRKTSNSVISQRALREIYLKGFEITVKKSNPYCIMTSYNKLNGVYPSENYDLLGLILREEWGYKNLVMTDWVNFADCVKEVKAGNDLKMPERDDSKMFEALKDGRLNRGHLTEVAKHILSTYLLFE